MDSFPPAAERAAAADLPRGPQRLPAAQAGAWAGALELMTLVLILTIAARVISARATNRRS